MRKEIELWQFVASRLARGKNVMLLVVAESSGSSPGRQGYKMAVAADGELFGSIGGGVMEVGLVERSRSLLDAVTQRRGEAESSILSEQVHRKDVENASGMICSGRQAVVFKLLTPSDLAVVQSVIDGRGDLITLTAESFTVGPPERGTPNAPEGGTSNASERGTPNAPEGGTPNDLNFTKLSKTDFVYTEKLGSKNQLYIVGGGHCALALSELMSRMDFHITVFDDRPQLNTISKNEYADDIKIVDSYERIGDHIFSGSRAYVVVMTLGYKSDEVVIRSLIEKEFKYFGVLGSKAKMSAMFRSLRADGISEDMLERIRTPIGLPINSHTPEEIAVSIAAEIILVKND